MSNRKKYNNSYRIRPYINTRESIQMNKKHKTQKILNDNENQ